MHSRKIVFSFGHALPSYSDDDSDAGNTAVAPVAPPAGSMDTTADPNEVKAISLTVTPQHKNDDPINFNREIYFIIVSKKNGSDKTRTDTITIPLYEDVERKKLIVLSYLMELYTNEGNCSSIIDDYKDILDIKVQVADYKLAKTPKEKEVCLNNIKDKLFKELTIATTKPLEIKANGKTIFAKRISIVRTLLTVNKMEKEVFTVTFKYGNNTKPIYSFSFEVDKIR